MSDKPSDERAGDCQERAGRVDPPNVQGDLVRVAGAMNQAEAEFVQALLLEEGIPSMLRRTRGFDVPDMLAAGPRDVMVPEAAHAAAREVLLQAEIVRDQPNPVTPPPGPLAALPARAVRRLLQFMRIYRPS